MVLNHTRKRNVQPTLYYARTINNDDYSPRIIDLGEKDASSTKRQKSSATEIDYASYATEFEERLSDKLRELFNPDIPFRRCDEQEAESICKYCDFKNICKR